MTLLKINVPSCQINVPPCQINDPPFQINVPHCQINAPLSNKLHKFLTIHMVKEGHKYVTLLQINVPRIMILTRKLGTFI